MERGIASQMFANPGLPLEDVIQYFTGMLTIGPQSSCCASCISTCVLIALPKTSNINALRIQHPEFFTAIIKFLTIPRSESDLKIMQHDLVRTCRPEPDSSSMRTLLHDISKTVHHDSKYDADLIISSISSGIIYMDTPLHSDWGSQWTSSMA